MRLWYCPELIKAGCDMIMSKHFTSTLMTLTNTTWSQGSVLRLNLKNSTRTIHSKLITTTWVKVQHSKYWIQYRYWTISHIQQWNFWTMQTTKRHACDAAAGRYASPRYWSKQAVIQLVSLNHSHLVRTQTWPVSQITNNNKNTGQCGDADSMAHQSWLW